MQTAKQAEPRNNEDSFVCDATVLSLFFFFLPYDCLASHAKRQGEMAKVDGNRMLKFRGIEKLNRGGLSKNKKWNSGSRQGSDSG